MELEGDVVEACAAEEFGVAAGLAAVEEFVVPTVAEVVDAAVVVGVVVVVDAVVAEAVVAEAVVAEAVVAEAVAAVAAVAAVEQLLP